MLQLHVSIFCCCRVSSVLCLPMLVRGPLFCVTWQQRTEIKGSLTITLRTTIYNVQSARSPIEFPTAFKDNVCVAVRSTVNLLCPLNYELCASTKLCLGLPNFWETISNRSLNKQPAIRSEIFGFMGRANSPSWDCNKIRPILNKSDHIVTVLYNFRR